MGSEATKQHDEIPCVLIDRPEYDELLADRARLDFMQREVDRLQSDLDNGIKVFGWERGDRLPTVRERIDADMRTDSAMREGVQG